jgi:sensor histidine kinase regulating citrate/malate metabolism
VNSKLQDAKEMGIEITSNVILPASVEVNTDDMVVILGNLLDNAIEACERVKGAKYIKLFMNYEAGCVIIRITNNFDKIINTNGRELVTRKKDKTLHGLGIKSVKSTVEKYNGITEICSEGKEFIVDIMFYL